MSHGSGLSVDLPQEERDLLRFPIEHRGQVFTPETLTSRMRWLLPGRDEAFLRTKVSSLNDILAQAGLAQGLIEEFHGVGFRLKPESELR